MLTEYSVFPCVTVNVAFLSPLTKVKVALLPASASSFGSAVKMTSASPFPEYEEAWHQNESPESSQSAVLVTLTVSSPPS